MRWMINNFIYNAKITFWISCNEERKNQDMYIKQAEEYDWRELRDEDIEFIYNEVLFPFKAYILWVLRHEWWNEESWYDLRFNYLLTEQLLANEKNEWFVRKFTLVNKNELKSIIDLLEDNPAMEWTVSYKIMDEDYWEI